MRVVILTGSGPEHRYVTRVLVDALGDAVKAIIIAEGGLPLHRRIRSYLRRYDIRQLASRTLAKLYAALTLRGRRRARTYARWLALPAGVPESWEKLVCTVPSHNGAACQEILRELAPDIIAVYGTGIIRSPVIRIPRIAILNMHTGLSPRYRGSDTIFWPLYNEEPEWIGVTVHVLDEGIDSGPIITTARPTIDADDTEDSLFCKAVIVGSPLYAESIRQVHERGVPQTPQTLEEGRNYRFVDRTVAADRRVRRLLRQGLLEAYVRSAR